MKSIIALGDTNIDLIIQLPKRQPGQTGPLSAEPRLFGGGTVANVAVGLARLGMPTSFVGMVGDDAYGRYAQQDLENEGIDLRGVRWAKDAPTLTVIAFIDSQGERTISAWPPRGGAHFKMQPDDIDADMIRNAAWLHTSGMCMGEAPAQEAMLYGMQIAQEAGVPVSFDLNLRLELWNWRKGQRETVERAVELSDVVLGSAAEEIIPLAGNPDREAAARILSGGKRTIIARLGKDGALAVSPTETVHVPSFETKIVDTIGAGDAFDAGFIAGSVQGFTLVDAVQWGNAVAAFKLGRASARGVPTRAELEQFLNERIRSSTASV